MAGGGEDDRIVSYGDSTVVRSDLRILRGPHCLNDRLIHFYLCHLAASPEESGVLLAPPSLSFLIANFPDPDPASLAPVLAPLGLPRKALLLLPVNDNPDVSLPEGGSHWSLLACHLPSRLFLHHDSSASRLNSPHARALHLRLARFLSLSSPAPFRYQEAPTPSQTNGYDCGLYVLAAARCICQWYCTVKNSGLPDAPPSWFDLLTDQLMPDTVHHLRSELLSLILNLMHQTPS